MKFTAPYDHLAGAYPESVAQVVATIRKGRGRLKDTDPSTWDWHYFVWVCTSPNGTANTNAGEVTYFGGTIAIGCRVAAYAGRSLGIADHPVNPIPTHIVQAMYPPDHPIHR